MPKILYFWLLKYESLLCSYFSFSNYASLIFLVVGQTQSNLTMSNIQLEFVELFFQ